ncbi:MAG: polysaccharide deacetylase family protein [Bacteroidota bacterium]
MYLVKTPSLIQRLLPSYLWRIPTQEKVLYLTFDDGPIPEITPWVLKLLKAYDAKATFFCVGDNVRKHPDIFRQLQLAGHAVGNHTFHHLDGWKTRTQVYLANVATCTSQLGSSVLFRPPYGHLKPTQAKAIKKNHRIVLWDVLSGDFDVHLTPEKCLANVLAATKKGSIIVFHDSLKAAPRLQYVLPEVLDYYSRKGFRFEAINEELVVKY